MLEKVMGCTYEFFGHATVCPENMIMTIIFAGLAVVFAVGFIVSVLKARRESGIGIEWGAAALFALCSVICGMLAVGII